MMRKYIIAFVCAAVSACSIAGQDVVCNLRTNNMIHPLGLDELPVFGWSFDTRQVGFKQTAYRIEIFENDLNGTRVWDTGKVADDKNANVELDYSQASRLKNTTSYVWTVTVWDNEGKEHRPSRPGAFYTGLAYELVACNDTPHDNDLQAVLGPEATFIGHPEIPLDADALVTYRISYDFRIEEGGTQAGFVYGANEIRMTNCLYNDYLIEGETYVNVVVDIAGLLDGSGPAKVSVYRKGYSPEDYRQPGGVSLLKSYNLTGLTRENMYDTHSMSLVCPGGSLKGCSLDGEMFMESAIKHIKPDPAQIAMMAAQYDVPESAVEVFLNRMNDGSLIINPTGQNGDNCKYPKLNDIGFFADGSAVFSNVSVRYYNTPQAEVFGHGTGAGYAIFEGLDGIAVNGREIKVTDTLVYADPSYGSEPMVRTEFATAQGKRIRDAKLFVTSRGTNEVYINGGRVGEDFMAPGNLQFYGTLRYSTYDVTGMLKKGANAIGAMLAPGWYGDEYKYDPTTFNWYGDHWGLLAKLRIEYEDGTIQEVNTNEKDWTAYLGGPVTYSSLYHGEYYDARKEAAVEGWSEPGFDDSEWVGAVYAKVSHPEFENPDLAGRVDPPARVIDTKKGTLINTPIYKFGENPERISYVFDMGENIVGVPRVKFNSVLPSGAQVLLRFGEIMVEEDFEYPFNAEEMDGMIYTENYRGARSIDRYIARGVKGETIRPRFTFHGWRYLDICIMSDELSAADIDKIIGSAEVEGLVVSSQAEITATFESSNPLLDRFFLNVGRSHLGNHIYVGTDCPQRNERLPFMGDQQIYSETAVYMGDMGQIYSNYAQLARDAQVNSPSRDYPYEIDGRSIIYTKNGVEYDPAIAATSVAWPLGGVTMAWDVYANNGDLSLAREHWPSMTVWIRQFANAAEQDSDYDYIFKGTGLSNHLQTSRASSAGTDQIATYGRALQYIAAMANALGYAEERDYYQNLFQGVKREFNEYLISSDDVPLTFDGRQTTAQSSYAIPIYYNMVDYAKHPNFVKNYVERCRNEGPETEYMKNGKPLPMAEYSVTSGFTGTPCILGSLAMHGEYYTVYRMLENEKFCSWLYPVTLGATSVWERWDSSTETGPNAQSMNSYNHYAFGVAAVHMITSVAGIQRGDNGEYNSAGFSKFVLQPVSGGSLSHAKGTYKSSYGLIESSWRADPDTVDENGVSDMKTYGAVVPSNTSATLYLPLGKTFNAQTVDAFGGCPGVVFEGYATHNGIQCARFRLAAGGYDFSVQSGELKASLRKGYKY